MKKTFMSLAVTALLGLSGVAASAAPVYPDFTVNEGSVPGAAANTFVADKMNGGYTEVITVEGGVSPTGLVFSSAAYVDFGSFFKNDGTASVISQINGLNGYGLYGIFYAKGVVSDADTFTGTSGQVELFIDPNQDTVKTIVNSTSVTVSGGDDDYRIAFSFKLSGDGGTGADGNPGAFDFLFSEFQLDPLGKLYFTAPSNPFYQFAIVNGDFDAQEITPGTSTVTGDVSAVFSKVPEPGSLALLGLGLAGLGFVQRRRHVAK